MHTTHGTDCTYIPLNRVFIHDKLDMLSTLTKAQSWHFYNSLLSLKDSAPMLYSLFMSFHSLLEAYKKTGLTTYSGLRAIKCNYLTLTIESPILVDFWTVYVGRRALWDLLLKVTLPTGDRECSTLCATNYDRHMLHINYPRARETIHTCSTLFIRVMTRWNKTHLHTQFEQSAWGPDLHSSAFPCSCFVWLWMCFWSEQQLNS